MSLKKEKAKFKRLRKAVVDLYTAAMWMPDRYVENEADLWIELRDAAGIDEGTKTSIVIHGLQIAEEER